MRTKRGMVKKDEPFLDDRQEHAAMWYTETSVTKSFEDACTISPLSMPFLFRRTISISLEACLTAIHCRQPNLAMANATLLALHKHEPRFVVHSYFRRAKTGLLCRQTEEKKNQREKKNKKAETVQENCRCVSLFHLCANLGTSGISVIQLLQGIS